MIMYDNNNLNNNENLDLEAQPIQNETNNSFDGSEYQDMKYIKNIVVEERKPKKGMFGKLVKLTASALVFGLVAGASFWAYQSTVGQVGSTPVPTNSSKIEDKESSLVTTKTDEADTLVKTSTSDTANVSDVSTVVEDVMPSIVSIQIKQSVQSNYFGQTYENEVEGSGSGIIIGQNDSEVLIATNNHVVAGATEVEITFSDETKAQATVKGTSTSNDLAVVAVATTELTASTKSAIKIATVGDSETLKAGEMVIAIGNALGYGQSVTVGYVSALDREVQTEDYTMSLIQTDAAINPGNSGGALLNAEGQVIGINSVKYSSEEVEGIGYAIPISDAIPIINDLMNREAIPESEQGYLGIVGNDVTEEYSKIYNIPVGIFIAKVSEGSPAQTSGIEANDVIVKFDDEEVSSMEDLQVALAAHRSGETIDITLQRQNGTEYKDVKVSVTLGTKETTQSTQQSDQQSNQENNQQSDKE